MHDCCIRVTTLLECFAWMLHKPHNRTGGLASIMLSMPSDWGSTFGAISFHYDQIFKGNVPFTLDHYWYQKGVWSLYFIVAFKTDKERTIHGPITTQAYYGCTNISPEILNFLINFCGT